MDNYLFDSKKYDKTSKQSIDIMSFNNLIKANNL